MKSVKLILFFLFFSFGISEASRSVDSLKNLLEKADYNNKPFYYSKIIISSDSTNVILHYGEKLISRVHSIEDNETLALAYLALNRYFIILSRYKLNNPLRIRKYLDSSEYYLAKAMSVRKTIQNDTINYYILYSYITFYASLDSLHHLREDNIEYQKNRKFMELARNIKLEAFYYLHFREAHLADSLYREHIKYFSYFNNHDQTLNEAIILSKTYESLGYDSIASVWLKDFRYLLGNKTPDKIKWDYYYKYSIYKWRLFDYPEAIKFCDTSLIIANQSKNNHNRSLSLDMKGIIFNSLGEWNKADSLFDAAYKIAVYEKNDTVLTRVVMNRSVVFLDQLKYQQAEKLLFENKEAFKRVFVHNKNEFYIVYLANLAECYFFMRDSKKFSSLIEEIELFSNFIRIDRVWGIYYLTLGRYYYLINDFKNSEKHLLKGWNYVEHSQELEVKKSILDLLPTIFKKLNKNDLVYEFMLKWNEVKDKLRSKKNNELVGKWKADQEYALDLQAREAKEILINADRDRKNTIIILLIIASVLMLVFVFIVYRERVKSEKLLLNILPKKIALRLKKKENYIAERFHEASVMFIDIANFTKLSSGITPEKLVSILNDIFTKFDNLSEKHGLEKIKTIGDCYLAVAGIPEPRIDHAVAAANMALEVIRSMRDYRTFDGLTITFRIGIDCGPVIAGIIGKNKFIYDIWSDTVNTASRMEDYGVIGEIQVSDRFKRELESSLIGRDNNYQWIDRGMIEMKGKGNMRTWLLREG